MFRAGHAAVPLVPADRSGVDSSGVDNVGRSQSWTHTNDFVTDRRRRTRHKQDSERFVEMKEHTTPHPSRILKSRTPKS